MFYLLITKISFFKVWVEVQTLSKNLDKKKKGNGKGILERGRVAYYTYNFNFTNEISFALFHFYNLPRKLGGGLHFNSHFICKFKNNVCCENLEKGGGGGSSPSKPLPDDTCLVADFDG